MRVVFDLDGTLADCSHRLHLISGETKDWDAFFDACDGDLPMRPAGETLIALIHAGHRAEIWSGRGEGPESSVRKKTVDWLHRHFDIVSPDFGEGFKPAHHRIDSLKMRPFGCHTRDVDLKREWLDDARNAGRAPDLVFDDRDRVVAMWREEGIPCFQVAPLPG